LEKLKYLDNFYLNYSNSPLSGGGINITKDCSNPSSRSIQQNEFESFTEMINSLQHQQKNEENKSELFMPKPIRKSSTQILQGKNGTC